MDKIINEYLVKKNEKPKINTIEKSKKKKENIKNNEFIIIIMLYK